MNNISLKMSNETAISKHFCSLNLTLAHLAILLYSKQIIIDQTYQQFGILSLLFHELYWKCLFFLVQNWDDFVYAAFGSTDHFCSYTTMQINI